jgi:hypothetical protein
MKPHVRAAAAAVSLSHALGRRISSIHDYDSGGYKQICASVEGGSVNAYDYDSSCYITGSMSSLYHYGEGAYLQLNATSSGQYSGFDYDTGSHFSVSISGNRAQIYDYGEGSYFTYSA